MESRHTCKMYALILCRSHKRAKTEKPAPRMFAGLPAQAAAATRVAANKALQKSAPAQSMPGVHCHLSQFVAAVETKCALSVYSVLSFMATCCFRCHSGLAYLYGCLPACLLVCLSNWL